MLLAAAAVLVGLGLLIWSADRFVDGAAATAHHLGMSPMLIGLTVIAFGTSAPEILVSAIAAWNQAPGLAIGNAIGSNIANIALVLGATALIAPLPIRGSLVRTELPILAVATVGAGVLLLDQHLGRIDGTLLLIGLVICLYLFKRYQDQHKNRPAQEIPEMALKQGLFWLVLGLVVLAAGSRVLVWGATDIAKALGAKMALPSLKLAP